ncbi:MAG: ferredoxin, partial [Candidatus Omnitrophota bacterium]
QYFKKFIEQNIKIHAEVRGKVMAEKTRRLPENATGKYYVDDQCIDCDLCRQIAPDNFAHSADKGYSYLAKLPASPEEEKQCTEAMQGCPVEAIGNDGE